MKIKFTYASDFNDKWRACFEVRKPRKGAEVISELCSALVFDTEDEAENAGHRAVLMFNETKKMPDLSERW